MKYLGSPAKLFDAVRTARAERFGRRGQGGELPAEECEAIESDPALQRPRKRRRRRRRRQRGPFWCARRTRRCAGGSARVADDARALLPHLRAADGAPAGGRVPAWRLASNGRGAEAARRASLGREESARDVARVRTNVRYAKPKARGPNPLACKKKREREPRGVRVRPAAGAAGGSRRRSGNGNR